MRFSDRARDRVRLASARVTWAVIEIRGVDKVYQTANGPFFALRNVHLSIAGGGIFGIIGRSGAGKSTLLRLLNLLEQPTAGELRIDGQDITQLSGNGLRHLRQQVGVIFQHFNLLSSRTVYENVRLPLRIAGAMTAAQERERIFEVLELVGLTDQARKYPRQLSGGQRQRVGIARALANHPRLLLCDEATSALDPETTQSILALLLDINRRLDLTIVLITHGMDVVRTVADRVAVLDHGQVVESGRVLDVYLNPRHATTRALLAESGMDLQGAVDGAQIGGLRLLRLTYQGPEVATPILTSAARKHDLDIIILQGSVGRIKDRPYAQLTVSVLDDEQRVAPFLRTLAQHNVHCERLA